MNNTISIIIPVYNSEKYLNECIKSLLVQSYKKIQIILINDGSTDSSPDICEKYAREDGRIIYISQKNKGVSATRNAGLKAATGSYVMFVDSDDYLPADALENFLEIMHKKNVDVVVGSYSILDKKICKFISLKDKTKEKNFIDFITTNCIWAPWGKLIKKCKITNFFDENVHVFEDYLFWASNKNLNSYAYTEKNIYYYRKVETSIMNTRKVNKNSISEFQAMKLAIEIVNEQCGNFIKRYYIERLFSLKLKYKDDDKLLKYNKGSLMSTAHKYMLELLKSNKMPFFIKLKVFFKYLCVSITL